MGETTGIGKVDGITPRFFALLRAVAAGRAEITCSRVSDLFIDGMCCCNQDTAHELVRAQLIRHARLGLVGQRVRAELTDAGRTLLERAARPMSA